MRETDQPIEGQRLDKWIWCARLVKTRKLAADLIAAGKIRVNGERTRKAGRRLRVGDVLTGTTEGRLWVLRVLEPTAARRGPASNASLLYQDLTPNGPPLFSADAAD